MPLFISQGYLILIKIDCCLLITKGNFKSFQSNFSFYDNNHAFAEDVLNDAPHSYTNSPFDILQRIIISYIIRSLKMKYYHSCKFEDEEF